MEEGYVYILTNPSFREDWVKIGKSSRPVDVRSKELDNTAVPLPFEIFATLQTSKYGEVEKLVHKMLDRFTTARVRQNREFFNLSPHEALDVLRDIAKTIDDAKILLYENNKPKASNTEIVEPPKNRKRRANFKFSMCGIKVGEKLTFIPTGDVVTVASDNQIEFNHRLYKLSAFAGSFMPEKLRTNSDEYQGPKFFAYEGKTLVALREKLEQK